MISLDRNELVYINETFFEGQEERLTHISADDNKLRNEGFPYSALEKLPNVYYLSLETNGITDLPVPIPPNNLTSMYYYDNFIDTIEEGTFQNCKELRYLYLFENSIRSLPPG